MSFANLKKKSGKNLDELQKKLEKENSKADYTDDRLWYPVRDKNKNGYAVIRFLPETEGNDLPWAKVYNHGFQGPSGRWFIENCPTTIGGKCPVCLENSEAWNTGTDAGKDIARKRKRRLNYYSNIYIVSDPATPENEGKVFLFRYGQKIFEKIQEAMNPSFEGEEAINPFDLWNGANFKLKIQLVHGQTNYDKSEFDTPGPLLDDDKELEKVWKSEYDLSEFTDEGEFKTYDELNSRFRAVLGESNVTPPAEEDDDDVPFNVDSDENGGDDSPSENEDDEKSTDDILNEFKNMADD